MFLNSASYSALDQFDSIGILDFGLGQYSNVAVFLLLLVFFLEVVTFRFFNGFSILGSVFFSNLIKKIDSFFNENLIIVKNFFFYGLVTIAFLILCGNVFGLIPFGLTLTSFLSLTLFTSSLVFFVCFVVGLRTQGLHFFANFVPPGTPGVLKAPLVVIELISYFARLFSLSIRLFANMMSGHSLLKILTGFLLLFIKNSFLSTYGLLPLAAALVVWAVTFLETAIAFLQTYVYVVLSCIYLNEAINGSH